MNKSSFHYQAQNLCINAFCFNKSSVVFFVLCFLAYVFLWMRPVLQWHNSAAPIFTPPSSAHHGFASPSPASSDLSQSQSLFDDEPVIILYWGYPWGIPSYVPPENQTKVTKEGYCVVTRDKRRIKNASAVLFHYTAVSKSDIPWKHYRDTKQVFIWWSMETPSIIKLEGKDLRFFDNFFNWTRTYRRDSDVPGSYGQRSGVIKHLKKGRKVVDQIIANKKKLAIWIVSQCDYTLGARLRLNYANKLRKAGLDFDGYGRCFHRKLPRDNYTHIQHEIKKYKFYFAFENGLHCRDYITEKFWDNALASDSVPIVWGPTKDDILSVAPLDSFIFAENYKSPQNLVDYLKFLDSNDQEYRKYFRWRENENMTDETMIKMVRERYPKLDVAEKPKSLCEKLIENRRKNGSKIIKSLLSEFVETNPQECLGDVNRKTLS